MAAAAAGLLSTEQAAAVGEGWGEQWQGLGLSAHVMAVMGGRDCSSCLTTRGLAIAVSSNLVFERLK